MKSTVKSKKNMIPVTVLVLVLAVALGAGAILLPRYTVPAAQPSGPLLPDTGLWISEGELFAGGTEEKPLTRKERCAELTGLTEFLAGNRVESLYWDLPYGKPEVDALAKLCRGLGKAEMKVYAVLPELLPDSASSSAEVLSGLMETILKKAEVAGFVLECDAWPAERVGELVELVRALKTHSGREIGLTLRAENSLPEETLKTLLSDDTVTLLLPEMSGQTEESFAERAEGMALLPNKKVIPLAAGEFSPRELGYRLFYQTIAGQTSGVVLQGYNRLKTEPLTMTRLLSYAGETADSCTGLVDLSISKELQIGYPANGASTPYGSIVLMGASDPSKPLTMNGQTVERKGTTGVFAVEVSLRRGANVFTFRQGDRTASVTVRRPIVGDSLITRVTAGSRFPADDMAVKAGGSITFQCVAPAGGKVTALFGKTEIPMKQTATNVKKGISAVFEGTYQAPAGFPAEELTELGKVTYVLDYLGARTTYESNGRIFVAGQNVTPMVCANTENVSIIKEYKDDSSIQGTLHLGARLPTTGAVQHNGKLFYAVEGGYISSDRAGLAIGVFPRESTVSEAESRTEGRKTTITFKTGNFPAVTAERGEESLRLTFRETSMEEFDPAKIKNAHITGAEVTGEGNNAVLTLALADPARLWGYDVQYTEAGDVELTLFDPPVLSQVPGKPLTGVTVMVDPGHGYKDPGALGVAGSEGGPCESEVNLAVSLALRERLEQLGATVLMTHETDIPGEPKVVLDERVHMAVESRPDFFLSVHHNSTGLVKEATADHMEIYYHEDIALPFAEHLRENMMQATGRPAAEPDQGYYYVTRLSFCPAVLFEVGYLPNPVQFEDCANWRTVYRSAAAMADAVLESVPTVPAPAEE